MPDGRRPDIRLQLAMRSQVGHLPTALRWPDHCHEDGFAEMRQISQAKAIKDVDYKPTIQPISGYVVGHERSTCWRVSIQVGKRWFKSADKYADQSAAERAARSIEKAVSP